MFQDMILFNWRDNGRIREMELEIIMSQNEYLKILNARADKITAGEVLDKIENFLLSDSQHYLVTLNPEMAVEARRDNHFRNIINQADLVIPDGIGIIIASKIINPKIPLKKISGIDLIHKICQADFVKNKRIYLVGGGEGIAEKAASALKRKYNYLDIVGAEEGLEIPNTKYQIPNEFQISNSKFRQTLSLLKGGRGISGRDI